MTVTGGIFTTAIPLSSHLSTASNLTFDQAVQADPGSGYFSVTARYLFDQLFVAALKLVGERGEIGACHGQSIAIPGGID
jgi:hypothetical protein